MCSDRCSTGVDMSVMVEVERRMVTKVWVVCLGRSKRQISAVSWLKNQRRGQSPGIEG